LPILISLIKHIFCFPIENLDCKTRSSRSGQQDSQRQSFADHRLCPHE
jgi:hypothetical protein